MLIKALMLYMIDTLNLDFTYNATPDVYTGKINFKPAGYYKYEVYEVSWTGAVSYKCWKRTYK
jgi:hypothetical protein